MNRLDRRLDRIERYNGGRRQVHVWRDPGETIDQAIARRFGEDADLDDAARATAARWTLARS